MMLWPNPSRIYRIEEAVVTDVLHCKQGALDPVLDPILTINGKFSGRKSFSQNLGQPLSAQHHPRYDGEGPDEEGGGENPLSDTSEDSDDPDQLALYDCLAVTNSFMHRKRDLPHAETNLKHETWAKRSMAA